MHGFAWKYHHEPEDWLKIAFLFSFLYAMLFSKVFAEIFVNLENFDYLLGTVFSALIIVLSCHKLVQKEKE